MCIDLTFVLMTSTPTAPVSGWAVAGFTVLAVALLAAVRYGASRRNISIVRCDPPQSDPDDPAHQNRRARAAAAAMLLHRTRQTQGDDHADR